MMLAIASWGTVKHQRTGRTSPENIFGHCCTKDSVFWWYSRTAIVICREQCLGA